MIYEEQTLTNKAKDEHGQGRTVWDEHGQVTKVVRIIAPIQCYGVYFLRFCTNYDNDSQNTVLNL